MSLKEMGITEQMRELFIMLSEDEQIVVLKELAAILGAAIIPPGTFPSEKK